MQNILCKLTTLFSHHSNFLSSMATNLFALSIRSKASARESLGIVRFSGYLNSLSWFVQNTLIFLKGLCLSGSRPAVHLDRVLRQVIPEKHNIT